MKLTNAVQAETLLSRLFHKVLMDRGLTGLIAWDRLMNQHVEMTQPEEGLSTAEKHQRRHHIRGMMASKKMTIKTFMTAILLLKPSKIQFGVKLTWPDASVSEHYLDLELGNLDPRHGPPNEKTVRRTRSTTETAAQESNEQDCADDDSE